MDLQLKDKVVFIAGGSRGIGLGIVETCLKEGASLGITARGAEALKATCARLADHFGNDRIWSMAGDMRDTATIEKALDAAERELGPIWGAVANVGLYESPSGLQVDDSNWDAAFSQNLDSAFRLARGALGRMTPRKEGSLVFISSIAGLCALETPLTYGTAKAAMNHLSKELAKIAVPAACV
jgi:3-oxoacyl-[acyl-carrier protein] reductase